MAEGEELASNLLRARRTRNRAIVGKVGKWSAFERINTWLRYKNASDHPVRLLSWLGRAVS
jgi:hypothetical protein